MISLEQVEKPQPQAQQAPSPAVEKQVPMAGEKRRPWLKPLKQTLGIVLPLLGGFAWIWSFVLNQPNDITGIVLVGGPLVGILGGVCVVLLFPFRWAIGIVPLVLAFGELLAFFFDVLFQGHWVAYSVVTTYSLALPFGVLVGFVLASLGALIGNGINEARR